MTSPTRVSPPELLKRARAVMEGMRDLIVRERQAVLAFDAATIATCTSEKTALMQELWLISATLRKEMMKEDHASDTALERDVRAYREAMLDVRRLLARNDRLIHFAQELTQTVLAAQQHAPSGYDPNGHTRSKEPAIFTRRA
ncbi:MAG: flagellar export chaperone FlgN [Deltaproteobacteria bacterium]|nr:flagellar export chaperone FlgN [Deltaproteobacteria bacterium]